MNRIASLLAALMVFPASAVDVNMEYKGFYSHLKKLDDEALNRLEFTFGFSHVGKGRLCQLNEVLIVTQKQTMEVNIGADNRFRLPTEKALQIAKARVMIDMEEATNQCDMSVQLQVQPKYLSSQYSQAELNTLLSQFNGFFSEMGGFFSFLMPGPQGIQMQFSQPVTVSESLSSKSKIDGTTLWLHEDDINKINSVTLSQIPHKITVWMED